jgi:hypothetical protein
LIREGPEKSDNFAVFRAGLLFPAPDRGKPLEPELLQSRLHGAPVGRLGDSSSGASGGVLYDLGESLSDTQRPSTVAGAAPTARAPADLLQQAGATCRAARCIAGR